MRMKMESVDMQMFAATKLRLHRCNCYSRSCASATTPARRRGHYDDIRIANFPRRLRRTADPGRRHANTSVMPVNLWIIRGCNFTIRLFMRRGATCSSAWNCIIKLRLLPPRDWGRRYGTDLLAHSYNSMWNSGVHPHASGFMFVCRSWWSVDVWNPIRWIWAVREFMILKKGISNHLIFMDELLYFLMIVQWNAFGILSDKIGSRTASSKFNTLKALQLFWKRSRSVYN